MTEIDWTVTLYKLFLGDQDSVTGHFRPGFTIHSIEIVIFPKGGTFSFGALGYHTVYNATGFTEYLVEEGDIVLDQLGCYYMIHMSPQRWGLGDQLKFLEVSLEEQPSFPFLAGFFGYEGVEQNTGVHPETTYGYGYEDGYERGQWAL